jgi:hypothetical protein
MGVFNVEIKNNNNQKKEKNLLDFMDKFQLKSQFSENTIKVGSQLYHIWANVPKNECKYGVTKTYWSNFHKVIYITFKLPNTFPMYNKRPLMSPFKKSVTIVII